MEDEKGLFSEFFKVLANLEIGEDEASFLWEEVLKNATRLSEKVGRKVGFRVALLDYMLNEKQIMKNPTFVEQDIFEEVMRNSFVDELTGIYNRRYFNTAFHREFKRSSRYEKTVSLFFFDVDNFKSFNDNYGHLEGDRVLQLIAKTLSQLFRAEDIVARIGGEEFAVLLPETGIESALKACERFAQKLRIASAENMKMPITVSGGIAAFPNSASTMEDLYKKADELSYKAKRAGKDRIVTE